MCSIEDFVCVYVRMVHISLASMFQYNIFSVHIPHIHARLQWEREIRLQRCREYRSPTNYTRGGLELGELPYQSTDHQQATLQQARACSHSHHNCIHLVILQFGLVVWCVGRSNSSQCANITSHVLVRPCLPGH